MNAILACRIVSGYIRMYFAFALLYLHAWRLRDVLDLSDIEKSDTLYLIRRLVSVALFALVIALLVRFASLPPSAGYLYFLIFPMLRLQHFFYKQRRKALVKAEPN